MAYAKLLYEIRIFQFLHIKQHNGACVLDNVYCTICTCWILLYKCILKKIENVISLIIRLNIVFCGERTT